MLVTIAVAISRSLTLLFCDAERKIEKARSCVQRSLAMIMPSAWSITVLEASDERSCSISAA
jgi:hypothetical protein